MVALGVVVFAIANAHLIPLPYSAWTFWSVIFALGIVTRIGTAPGIFVGVLFAASVETLMNEKTDGGPEIIASLALAILAAIVATAAAGIRRLCEVASPWFTTGRER